MGISYRQRGGAPLCRLAVVWIASVASCRGTGWAVETLALPADHGQHDAVMDCDCAGCRAYRDACQLPPACEVWESDDCEPIPPTQSPAPYQLQPEDGAPPEGERADGAPYSDLDRSSADREPLAGSMPSLSSMGAIAAASSATPSMIGDNMGSWDFEVIYTGNDYPYYQDPYIEVITPAGLGGAPGANVGRQKLGENGSAIPRDRFINNFSFFKNTPLLPGGEDVTRDVVGVEKTFFDGLTSLEFRVPFAATVDNNVTLAPGGIVGDTTGELGNMTLYGKLLLIENRQYAIGAGLGVTAPTADDFILRDETGAELLRVENESPHLLPFLGIVVTPNRDLFYQAFVQVDVDTQGNPVQSSIEDGFVGSSEFVGRLRDRELIFADMSVGYWLHRDPQSAVITGLAPVVEVHYNGSLSDGDALQTNTVQSAEAESLDLVNAVVGTIIQFNRTKNLMLAYTTPLSGDEQFDGEFRMSVNWFFGPSAQRYAGYAF